MQYRTIEETLDEFSERGWDEISERNFLMLWLDQTPEDERTNESFRKFLEHAAELEGFVEEKKDEPTVNFTARQINRSGKWLRFCEWHGMNEYAMSEGQCDKHLKFTIKTQVNSKLNLDLQSTNREWHKSFSTMKLSKRNH